MEASVQYVIVSITKQKLPAIVRISLEGVYQSSICLVPPPSLSPGGTIDWQAGMLIEYFMPCHLVDVSSVSFEGATGTV